MKYIRLGTAGCEQQQVPKELEEKMWMDIQNTWVMPIKIRNSMHVGSLSVPFHYIKSLGN
jgi:hypothetical protein